MTEWDHYYMNKPIDLTPYTPEDIAANAQIERTLRYALLAILILAILFCLACIELY